MAAGFSNGGPEPRWRVGLIGSGKSEDDNPARISKQSAKPLLAITGPTASGKSALAMAIAETVGGQIIACDSVQVYRRYNIGSAKPGIQERLKVTHHLIDCVDSNEDFDASTYSRLASTAIDQIDRQEMIPIICGGTGLYLKALLGLNFHPNLPQSETLRQQLAKKSTAVLYDTLQTIDRLRADQLHPNDRLRIARSVELAQLGSPISKLTPVSPNLIGQRCRIINLEPNRTELHLAIEKRVGEMLKAGLLEEVRELLGSIGHEDHRPMGSIGYAQCVAVIKGRLRSTELKESIIVATRRYAKRQCTLSRGMPNTITLNRANLKQALAVLK